MDQLLKILTTVDNWLWGNWLLFVLIGVGILYTVITGFVQVRHFPYIIRKSLIEPLMGSQKDSQESGSISSFQALCTAVASCVGSGNIVGVSTAVLTGGLGAIFWMWVAAFVGMATKYGEIILGLMYREKDENGAYVGGPMYYIKKGLHAPWLAVLCAIFMITQIIGGNFIQSNTISGVMHDNFQVPHLVTGIVLVILIFTITLGGLKRLAHVTQKLVPIMATIYVIGGLLIILANITNIPGVLVSIIRGAFGLDAVAGGAIGSMIIAMQRGVARGLYSNEAGEGSAPVIHSAANVNHPAEQGMTGVIEVFLDTFVICTITGLVLGVTGILDSGAPANVIVTYAFASVWPPLKYLVAISLLLFSSTTLMSQWYFGHISLTFLNRSSWTVIYRAVFPILIVVGSLSTVDLVWSVQDVALGLLIIPNILALICMGPRVRQTIKEFLNPQNGYVGSEERVK